MALPREVHTRISESCFDAPILLLGKVGENLATKVVFDASEWYDGSGTFQLLVKRADEEMLTATVEQNEGVISWLIPAAEIGAAGYGEIELNYIVGEAKMKSARVDTRVFSSIEIDRLTADGTTWSQLVLSAVSDARAAANAAEESRDALEDDLADAVAAATDASARSAQEAQDSAKSAQETADALEERLDEAVTSASKDAADASKTAAESAKAAGNSASSASTAATNAGNSARAAEKAKSEVQTVHDKIFDVLYNATILDTTENVTLNDEGLVATITHTSNSTGAIIRTDTFTYEGSVVTEIRKDSNGRTQKNIYDLETLSQQFNV